MNEFGMGAGLAALGFWLFVAVVIFVGVWAKVRRREMQLRVVQQMLESGQKIDQEVLERIFPPQEASRNAGLILVVLGIVVAAIGFNASVNIGATVALGAISFVSGACVWIRADQQEKRIG